MKDFLAALLAPLISAIDWIRQWVNGVWVFVLGFIAWLLTPIKWFLKYVEDSLLWMSEQLDTFRQFVDDLWDRFFAAYGQIGNVLSIANGIVPLNHIFAALTMLFSLWLIALIYRLVKSWIPTVA